jgi:hydrogenase maturation protein HypF
MSRNDRQRIRINMHGALQGVGFRPHVYRLAKSLQLSGWVRNDARGVTIEAEGERPSLETLLVRVVEEMPPHACAQSIETAWLDPAGLGPFEIRESSHDDTPPTAFVLPDIATCRGCLDEIRNESNRRYRYPFTNCTNCGPRYSIIEGLPYDRARTTMKAFVMCAECQAEYEDPEDRRFHAQPNACPACGPRVEVRNRSGLAVAFGEDALGETERALVAGKIVALKGIGGFHLMADARNETVVRTLRERKHREEKPLAVMFPSLDSVRSYCVLSPMEERVLTSPAAPIVLVQRRPENDISPSVAPGNPWLGAMLPYTPLHHLLLADLSFPVVATSGNISDEPICFDEDEAIDRLGNIADLFLVHNRPIARHVDDSVVRVVAGRDQILRRARGYAPLPVTLEREIPPVLAVGGHLKNTVAVATGREVFVSQHIGDLETEAARAAFEAVIESLEGIYAIEHDVAICDAHPDYSSTRYARKSNVRRVEVQHHIAHIMACAAENGVKPPFLGVSWDGTGYGTDGTVWGGEFFTVGEHSVRRFAHFRTFALPGGEAAIREPRRSAIGLLHEMSGQGMRELRRRGDLATAAELNTLISMLERGVNSPRTSSAGRLFDAVSALLCIRYVNAFEGQAAMELEFQLSGGTSDEALPFDIQPVDGESEPDYIVDWAPAIETLIRECDNGTPIWLLSAKFHNGLAQSIAALAKHAKIERVVLSGGCFQNRYLTERAIDLLRATGQTPHWHQRIPPNDGGIALGQIAAACHMGVI